MNQYFSSFMNVDIILPVIYIVISNIIPVFDYFISDSQETVYCTEYYTFQSDT